MDNIGDMLSAVLSDPDAVARLRETARQLGLTQTDISDTSETPSAPPSSPPEAHSSSSSGVPDLMGAMGKLVPMLGKLQEDDDMSRLIHALKPFLSGSRLKKAEEADKIMAILRLVPLLRDYGASGTQPPQEHS